MSRRRLNNLPNKLNEVAQSVSQHMLEDAIRILDKPLSRASERAVEQAVTAGQSDPFGDGDQDPVPNPDHHPLRAAWATGLDWQDSMMNRDSPPLHRICFFGDPELAAAAVFQEHCRDGTPITNILERRLSKMRLTPLHLACQGARLLGDHPDPQYPCKYEEVIDLLLSLGARVDCKDIAGHTPLSVLIGLNASPITLNLVPKLVEAGANPNMLIKFGEPILMQCVVNSDREAFTALIKAGARLDVCDSHGTDVEKMITMYPAFKGALAEGMRDLQQEAKDESRRCDLCGRPDATKTCAGCKQARYCNRECQRTGWRRGHKNVCNQVREEAEVKLVVDDMTIEGNPVTPGFFLSFTNNITGATSQSRMEKRNVGKKFIVKVNKPMDLPNGVSFLKINQRNSDFLLVRPEGAGREAFEKLKKVVQDGSMGAGKVYLKAVWLDEEKDTLQIDAAHPQPSPDPLW